ncbi:MAG: glycoside hydrolase family 3 C-terminal domain-containing protein [Promicromonosporaceae bacterium]|nr:glycoside hydrolase family 3 C-terminal domain-containing protein [Promicromonosporaceae bacterium]
MSQPAYLNPALPIPERVADLLGRMTIAEKVGQMMQLDAQGDLADLILGQHVGSILHTSPERAIEAHELTDRTRLQIPLLIGEDCIHGHSFFRGATIFPTQLGMAATWDADLIEQVARATAVEASATGCHWTFSPVLCIARDLRWGRISETFGEDPYLIGEFAAAMVRGYQGDGLTDPTAILATAKHFAAYSETQGGRDASEADVSRRKMRSWFLPPFERVARAGCRTFMLGYQTTDGVPITVNDWLLTDVLRGEWGYTGTLITDWDNVGRMVWEQKVMPDYPTAAAAAVKAGNDMVMTTPQFFAGAQEAIAFGLLAESDLDAPVSRILTLKFELGLFEDRRRPSAERIAEVIGSHQDLNLEVARRSLVLLRNDDDVLPLAQDGAKRIAVIGPLADDEHNILGDWAGASGQVDWLREGHPREMTTTVLDGLRAGVPAGWEVTYAQGAEIVNLLPNPASPTWPDGQPRWPIVEPAPADPGAIAAAVRAAEAADYVVAVVGDRIELVGEVRSTATLDLIGGQIALLDALAEVAERDGKPLIVVLLASKPLVLPASVERAAALLWVANPGMRGGQAIAELIFGAIEPAGRLPISFARHVGQQPIYYNQVRGQHGRRYADLTQDPAFAFGEGLSFTSVEYSDLRIVGAGLASLGMGTLGLGWGHETFAPGAVIPPFEVGTTVRAQVTLTNTGARPALETVQVYVSDLVTSASWAERELKGYRQVMVEPGASVVVDLELSVAACTIVNARGERVVEPGEFELQVGPNSRPETLLRAAFTVG